MDRLRECYYWGMSNTNGHSRGTLEEKLKDMEEKIEAKMNDQQKSRKGKALGQ